MAEIMKEDERLKEELDNANREKTKKKELCDKMKMNIKANRERYKKQEKEFRGLIDDEDEQIPSNQE